MGTPILQNTLGHDTHIQHLWQAWQNDKLGPAWLFAGPEGVGKKRTALGLAQRILCEQQPAAKKNLAHEPTTHEPIAYDPSAHEPSAHEPSAHEAKKREHETNNQQQLACGQCGECIRVEAGTNDAVLQLSNPHIIKADQARDLVQFFQYRAQKKMQLAIVDNAHRMHPTAANILLKTLEELPPRGMIILISASPFSLLPTLRSRVQRLCFQALSEQHLAHITGAQGWQLKAARGRASEVDRLNEHLQLRQNVFTLWARVLKHLKIEPVIHDLKELSTSIEICLQALQFFLQLLRDARVWQITHNEAQILHIDQLPLIQQTAGLNKHQLNFIIQEGAGVEKSILANYDRSLCLEMWLRRAFRRGPKTHLASCLDSNYNLLTPPTTAETTARACALHP